jgi:D-3-phosphoglycerate dehydrogenase
MRNDILQKPQVVVAAKAHSVLTNSIQNAGYEIIFITPDKPGWGNIIQEATGLVIASGIRIDESFLSEAKALKWIARLGSGMELIDIPAAEKRGIKVVSSPEGNSLAVGEHALGMLLGLLHKITSSYCEVRAGAWIRDANRGTELSGKTVGIIGYGHTGSAFAKVLRGFDVTILAHDKYMSGFSDKNIIEASKEKVLAESDVISLHLPLTKETYHYADESFFSQIQKKPILINTSRGEVHNTHALIQALEDNIISGLALDVLENERLASYSMGERQQLEKLLNMPNVLLTPHIAGYSHEAFYKMSLVVAEKLGL